MASGGASEGARRGLAGAAGVLASAARSVEGGGGGGPEAALREVAAGLVRDLADRAGRDPEGMLALLRTAFGARADGPAGRALLARLAAGALPLPALQLAGAETLPPGARGAYLAGDGGTILLHRDLLSDPAALRRVLAEELGHHLDRLLGPGDAVGDEGAVFARLLAGGRLGAGELAGSAPRTTAGGSGTGGGRSSTGCGPPTRSSARARNSTPTPAGGTSFPTSPAPAPP